MGRKKRTDKEVIKSIEKNCQTIARNSGYINEKLDRIHDVTKVIGKNTSSKAALIVAILTLIFTIIPAYGIYKEKKTKVESAADFDTEAEEQYKIFLYPEYSTLTIYTEVEMTASLNFETDAVSITAYLASGEQDTIALERKNEKEWQKKVQFTEIGVHKVVATAIAPNGEVINDSIEVKVTPVGNDMDYFNQLFAPMVHNR